MSFTFADTVSFTLHPWLSFIAKPSELLDTPAVHHERAKSSRTSALVGDRGSQKEAMPAYENPLCKHSGRNESSRTVGGVSA